MPGSYCSACRGPSYLGSRSLRLGPLMLETDARLLLPVSSAAHRPARRTEGRHPRHAIFARSQ
ncbi:hypothetical protein BD626DRAFT_220500 [Schizophyllum amplum]|uniref:Uncharacterized protein n=1 Tax=Schizophyllum amplum TaxID=97359 RepID=A0A550CL70_9AGAR|nr:hypothetical protein BD626DRAFT_220500 [Auriculariopsis ampla]